MKKPEKKIQTPEQKSDQTPEQKPDQAPEQVIFHIPFGQDSKLEPEQAPERTQDQINTLKEIMGEQQPPIEEGVPEVPTEKIKGRQGRHKANCDCERCVGNRRAKLGSQKMEIPLEEIEKHIEPLIGGLMRATNSILPSPKDVEIDEIKTVTKGIVLIVDKYFPSLDKYIPEVMLLMGVSAFLIPRIGKGKNAEQSA